MKSTGIIRIIDKFGKIEIPSDLLEMMKWEPGTPVEFTIHGQHIHLGKHVEGCIFCNSKNVQLFDYNGLKVCAPCAKCLGRLVNSN